MSTIWICGVDEAGRGPLVGAVVAGAVVLDPQQPIVGLKDSKKLSPAKREILYTEIMSKAKAWGIGEASPQEIDQFNILQATMLAMQRAIQSLVDQMGGWPGEALIDGNRCPSLPIPARAIVQGDAKEPAISAASILAKVHRDRQMQILHLQFPQYGFNQHSIVITQGALAKTEIAHIIHKHCEQCPEAEIQLVDEVLWPSISELECAPQIMGLVRLEPLKNTSKNLLGDTIILDAVQDAGNVGTILRTALACHFYQIVCTVGTAHIWSPKVIRAAMGAHRYLTFYEAQSVDEVTSNIEAPLLATAMTAERSLYSMEALLQKPVAWVFGNEGQGVSPELSQQATSIRVPQNPKLESLNVASTAAVCLYETLRVRGQFNT
ncbi:MAG: ribonuclease HII [Burkholderiaceae bacterium]|nr:ribonuclease HII [Burkholderiaceae bacterium]